MAETTKVVAKMRSRAGKGGARSSRRDGLIPAVIYGDKQAPVMIAVEGKSVMPRGCHARPQAAPRRAREPPRRGRARPRLANHPAAPHKIY